MLSFLCYNYTHWSSPGKTEEVQTTRIIQFSDVSRDGKIPNSIKSFSSSAAQYCRSFDKSNKMLTDGFVP
jgi:hypothetical protein